MEHDGLTERVSRLRAMGHAVSEWSNGPHVQYEVHAHPYRKILVCVSGSITFHVASGDRVLAAGDELDLPPGTPHAATVGPHGVTCIEAAVA